jgi:ribosomal protein S18 acetylase RimI-like enzyme
MQPSAFDGFTPDQVLEIVKIAPEHLPQLTEFFHSLANDPETLYFHPHTFDEEAAHQIANYIGQDLYYAMLYNSQMLGYGMLRGWDEGYVIPSLGIAIHTSTRNMGLGKLLMNFLHAAAWLRGAIKVRLKVSPENTAAILLYTHLGYQFLTEKENDQLVAYYSLE